MHTQAAEAFYARLLRENPVLLGRILEFYRLFVERVPQKALSQAGDRARALAAAPALLARHEDLCLDPALGIEGRDDNFEPAPARVALLSPALLRQAALYCGMVLCREKIARLVARTEVENLRQEVGQEAYAFALGRAATYASHARHARLTTEKVCPQGPKDLDAASPAQGILAWGRACVLACAASGGLSLAARVKVLLGCGMAGTALLTVPVEAAWPLMRVLLFKEVPCPPEFGECGDKGDNDEHGEHREHGEHGEQGEQGWASFFA